MPDQIYALQQDVDMIATQVQNLTRTISNIDFIVHRIQKMELEQMCIGAQLGRLEKAFVELKYGTEERFVSFEQRLDGFELRLDNVESRLDKVEQRLNNVEHRLDRIERLLELICQKMDIKTV